MDKRDWRGGFTLIELALSLVFIAILSLTVVLLIQNTTASYRRGLMLNQLNTVGMDLVDDFRISIQNAESDSILRLCEIYYGNNKNTTSYNLCVNDNAESFIMLRRYAEVDFDGDNLGARPVYGALCTGTYTYVWNSGFFPDVSGMTNRNVKGVDAVTVKIGEETYSNFRLLKVYDAGRLICANAMKEVASKPNISDEYLPSDKYNEPGIKNGNIPESFSVSDDNKKRDANEDDAVELLKDNAESDLVLYDLYFSKPAMSVTRNNLFFAGSFILGTRRGGVNIAHVGNTCKPPADADNDLDYCAINKFNFAVQAGGGAYETIKK